MRAAFEAKHDPFFVQKIKVSRGMLGLPREVVFAKMCEGKRVLHIGCADWPITDPATSLHVALGPYCARLDGFDPHAEALAALAPHMLGTNLLYANLEDVTGEYDLVLVPEVMEHVADVEGFLAQLHRINAPRYVITVPDAARCAPYHFHYEAATDTFVEIVHPDHNCWYSPFTLTNVIRKFTPWKVEGVWFFTNISLMAVCSK